MKFSSIVPSQDLQAKSDLGALDFKIAVSAVSNSKGENESRPENVQVKKDSRLESMLSSMALLQQKKKKKRKN